MIFKSLSTPSRLDRYDSRWVRKSRLGVFGFGFCLVGGGDGLGSMV